MFKLFRNRRHSEEHVDELLSAHLDGELTPDEQVELQALLQREPGLQERLESLSLTKEALAGLPQVEAPRNFILSPAMVAGAATPAAPPRRPAWLALGWATAAATLLLIIVLAGDIFIVAPSKRQEPSEVVALVTKAPQPALGEGYVLTEVMPETEEQDADLTAQQPIEEKAIAPTALGEAITLAGMTAEVETEGAEQPGAEVIAPVAVENSTQDGLLAGTATQTPLAQQAMEAATAGEATLESASQPPPPAAQPGPTATVAAPTYEAAPEPTSQPPPPVAQPGPTITDTALAYETMPELEQPLSPEQPEAEPPAALRMAVETNDEAQSATLATAKSAATEPAPPTWMATPTPTAAPASATTSGALFWLRGLELVLGLSVIILTVATWIARRRR